jgi:hypothetical protein
VVCLVNRIVSVFPSFKYDSINKTDRALTYSTCQQLFSFIIFGWARSCVTLKEQNGPNQEKIMKENERKLLTQVLLMAAFKYS